MTKTVAIALLVVLELAACSTTSLSTMTDEERQYRYGVHAGQPMRDAPDTR
jgi:uncharacterized lipoprotein